MVRFFIMGSNVQQFGKVEDLLMVKYLEIIYVSLIIEIVLVIMSWVDVDCFNSNDCVFVLKVIQVSKLFVSIF